MYQSSVRRTEMYAATFCAAPWWVGLSIWAAVAWQTDTRPVHYTYLYGSGQFEKNLVQISHHRPANRWSQFSLPWNSAWANFFAESIDTTWLIAGVFCRATLSPILRCQITRVSADTISHPPTTTHPTQPASAGSLSTVPFNDASSLPNSLLRRQISSISNWRLFATQQGACGALAVLGPVHIFERPAVCVIIIICCVEL